MAPKSDTQTKLVYDFHEGNKGMKDLLGGKGANLAEMTNIGLPVPPGFTITTEACLSYLEEDRFPAGLMQESEEHLGRLEEAMGKVLGDDADPLLVSVRSGAKFSMPGMMDTVLNLGLNDKSVQGLAKQTSNERFAWTPTGGSCRCSARSCSTSTRSASRSGWTRPRSARARRPRTPTWTRTTCAR